MRNFIPSFVFVPAARALWLLTLILAAFDPVQITRPLQPASSMPGFTDVASTLGVSQMSAMYGPNAVDYNQDQRLDLLFTNHLELLSLFEQTESGGFTDVSFPSGINSGTTDDQRDKHGAAWGDCDEDGHLDLYVANGSQQPDRLFHNQGNDTFADIAPLAGVNDPGRGRSVSWIDYDRDGDLDIFLTNTEDKQDVLYRNDGDCTFADVSASAGDLTGRIHRFGVVWADYDTDGDMDVFAQSGAPPGAGHLDAYSHLYRNNGDGAFTDVTAASGLPLSHASNNAAWGDYDNDGDLDLFISRYGSVHTEQPPADANRLYRNNGDGTFTNVSNQSGVNLVANSQHATWADFDNDGDLDLYVTNAGNLITGNEPNFLYENQGNGTFQEIAASVGATGVTGEGMSGGMAVGDTNNDGFLDVVITHGLAGYGLLPGPHELLQNGGNANHWLQIRLVGQQSNRLGIGARVEIRSPDGHFQMREMNGGVHNYAQDEMIVSFGLANQTIVSQLTIYWPSGAVQHLTNVASNQRLTIAETAYKIYLPLILNNKQATATD